ncbi:hypothetical protein QMA60_09515 [Leuconostoc suionicum]|uniref:DUF2178 domain-containing protein n=1 Tax=Leuconostoc suionicum TaxID=1511761 RepID=UPI0024ACC9EC|nr:DUF2178 domain-containing protein [Leuconostoc suionicum]MDI6498765.1 hypothetical protein [Leuconostoc suionicum]MDI6500793.1 hypothetical protein [Leuconostoc suionicum]MDI6502455.1 hypothetical protein [Leuconostoc suionicum]MDI6614728.1 hypothetical protein [Leuconostoc suionicum]MDI6665852.1 hypothetical protein [Leuconostoc suionicum]
MMKDKENTINYKEIGIFILVLLAIIFILLKVVPVNFRYGILIAVGISMIIMPMTKKKIIDHDERNYQIDLQAKAIAFNILEIVFGLLLLSFTIMHITYMALVLTLTAYLILKIVNLMAFSYYHKNN